MSKIFYFFLIMLLTASSYSFEENKKNNELWVNVDYCDEVVYCKNLGYSNYGEKEIEKYFKQLKELGVTGVQWRVSVTGHMMYKSKVATVFPGNDDLNKYPDGLKLLASTLK